jgi:hypothetical protein
MISSCRRYGGAKASRGAGAMNMLVQSMRVEVEREFEVLFLFSVLGLLLSCALFPALDANAMRALMLAG